MPRKYTRTCSICGKSDLKNLSSHLDQVHDVDGEERTRYLQIANSTQDKILTNPKMSETEIRVNNYSNINSAEPVAMKGKHEQLTKQLLFNKPAEKSKNRSKQKVPLLQVYK